MDNNSREILELAVTNSVTSHELALDYCSDVDYDDDNDPDFTHTQANTPKRPRTILSSKGSATLDRTNSSIRKSSMIVASVLNEIDADSSLIPSKSTLHRHMQKNRQTAAETIQQDYHVTKCVVHWDGKLLPDLSGSGELVDRLPVLLSSLIDGNIKLLGVPKVESGTGLATAKAVHEQLHSWQSETAVVGMCFDTTAANTGKFNGACQLLEVEIGRNLLWLPCRHHMLEVLLSDVFGVCFGPSTGPEILIFKRFQDKWSKLNTRQYKPQKTPLITAPEALKNFILHQLSEKHPRDDYKELLLLAGLMTGIDVSCSIRKPGAMHHARWMAKAIYSLKIELLLDGNEAIIQLKAQELLAVQRFNRFVVLVYIKSWFTSKQATDAAVNDIQLITRLNSFDDEKIKCTGLNAIKRHSWYLSPELANLALFSNLVSDTDKKQLATNLTESRAHLLQTQSLPTSIADIQLSRSFYRTMQLEDDFLDAPVENWNSLPSFLVASETVKNIICTNDCAERGDRELQ